MLPFAQMVFRTLQTYGAVVVDKARAVMVEAENSNDWAFAGNTGTDPITTSFAGKPQYSALNGMPWSQLQVIIAPSLGEGSGYGLVDVSAEEPWASLRGG